LLLRQPPRECGFLLGHSQQKNLIDPGRLGRLGRTPFRSARDGVERSRSSCSGTGGGNPAQVRPLQLVQPGPVHRRPLTQPALRPAVPGLWAGVAPLCRHTPRLPGLGPSARADPAEAHHFCSGCQLSGSNARLVPRFASRRLRSPCQLTWRASRSTPRGAPASRCLPAGRASASDLALLGKRQAKKLLARGLGFRAALRRAARRNRCGWPPHCCSSSSGRAGSTQTPSGRIAWPSASATDCQPPPLSMRRRGLTGPVCCNAGAKRVQQRQALWPSD